MSGIIKKIAAFIAAKKWIGIISGWGIWGSTSVYYDRVVYPGLMLWLGNFWGGIVAASGAMIICTGFLLYYELTKSSWISSTDEVLNKIAGRIKKIEGYNIIFKIIFFIPRVLLQFSLHFISKRGKLGFIALSCISDPFITSSYFRNGKKDSLKCKDWFLFAISGLIANTYWIFYTAVILAPLRFVWTLVTH